uniref:Transmembrane protein n=1 Tax=Medicago truncatula TaxID=3880 RepID=I3S8S2_MEDTR|nr:unknown [Medicago truncatula]
MSQQHQYNIHKAFLFCNYILLSASSSCISLTLSLNLFPSICGIFFILLHAFTIAGAVSASASSSITTLTRWYSAHMVVTVLTAIFQGSVSVLIFTRTEDFLVELKSYVREEDGSVILKLCGGLTILIFLLEWVVLILAFFLKCYSYHEGGDGAMRSGKVQNQEDLKDWPLSLQL